MLETSIAIAMVDDVDVDVSSIAGKVDVDPPAFLEDSTGPFLCGEPRNE
jgi:hypothetical protein